MPDTFTSKFADGWKCQYPSADTELMRTERDKIISVAHTPMRPCEIGRKVGLNAPRTRRLCVDAVQLGLMETCVKDQQRLFWRKQG